MVVGHNGDEEVIVKKLLLECNNMDVVKCVASESDNGIFAEIDKVNKVYLTSGVSNEYKDRVISHCIGRDKTVYIVPNSFELAMINSSIVQIDDVMAIKVENLYLSEETKLIKRMLDIIISFVGIIVTLPIMLITAILIKVHDGGDVLFKQERVTINNKRFNVLKFRSMIVDAEKFTGAILATEKDPRITKLGRFIRSTRIDELPQLFNVFFGDMSLVGPRPERPVFVEAFEREIPDFKYRLTVKAGLTGLAQIMGKYTTTAENKVKYDLLYIRRAGFLYDMKILFQTVKVLFMKSSSSGVSDETTIDDLHKKFGIKVEKLGEMKMYIYGKKQG